MVPAQNSRDEPGPERDVGPCIGGRTASPAALLNIRVAGSGQRRAKEERFPCRDVAFLSHHRLRTPPGDAQDEGDRRKQAKKYQINVHGMKGTEGIRIPDVSGWGITPKEAVILQRELSPRVRIGPVRQEIRSVAAVDVSIRNRIATGAIVVVDVQSGEIVEAHSHTAPAAFPYVPGLLSFREIPALMPVIEALEHQPDVFMCDGQGIAHPRRFGLASHVGVLFDTPSFGVAKKKFIGSYEEPANERGSVSPLMDDAEEIGAVLRTRAGVKPVFVSAGHLIDLPSSIELTLRLTSRFRMPDPARMAHRLSKDGIPPLGSKVP